MKRCESCGRQISGTVHIMCGMYFCSKACAVKSRVRSIKNDAESQALVEYAMTAKVLPIGDYDMCAACDADLGACDTIWAAEGILYCSRECGIHDFRAAYGDDAEGHFDEVAEEVNPQDIGIERRQD